MSCRKLFTSIAIVTMNFSGGSLAAQPASFPVPSGNSNQLFFLQRTPNVNTIVCELNYKDGKVNPAEPVHVFWIRYGEKGQRQELNYIQRTFAYGIKHRKLGERKYELYFVSNKKIKMYLISSADGKFHVYSLINKKMCILNRIYLEIHGGTFWAPNVKFIELSGTDPALNQPVKEKIKV